MLDATCEALVERLAHDGILGALENLVRIGTVTWKDDGKRTARVKFQDTGLTSGELHVLASGHTLFENKKPNQVIKPWMPELDAVVLCLYLPLPNADGFILGEIGALGDIKQ